MQSITPCQRRISDRFPVASFAVNVPPSRLFEIVCATDPHLLRPEHRGKRTAQNFFTSRTAGLLRAPAGQATYLVPPEQLRRFAGRQRLYFALASYGTQRGDDPRLSVGLAQIEQTPSILLSADFTGRTLHRARLRGAAPDGRYGAANTLLTWGGDTVLAAPAAPAPRAPAPRDYDDGFPPELWQGRGDGGGGGGEPRDQALWSEPSDPRAIGSAELDPPEISPAEEYEEMGHSEAYGRRVPRRAARPPAAASAPAPAPAFAGAGAAEPPGFEDAVALSAGRARFGHAPPHAPQPPPSYGTGCAQPACARCGGAAAWDAHTAHAPHGGHATWGSAAGHAGHAAGEPPGAEDASQLARYGAGEPPGAEDAPQLARYGGGRRLTAYGGRAAYGDDAELQPGAPAEAAPPPPAAPPPTAWPGATLPPPAAAAPAPRASVDDDWREDDDEPDLPSTAADGAGEPLTIRRKFEIIMPVLLAESGDERYRAVAGSVEYDDPTHAAYQRVHYGVHWGIASFNQRSGALGQVLRACARRDAARFAECFGAAAVDPLIAVTTAESPDARLLPVDGALLWSPQWLERFRRAGDVAPFQAAQNEVAIERYVDRNLGFAAALGLVTDRALAMLFDRTIHMGLAGARAWILAAASPLTDDGKVQQALAALGHADLAAFQRAAGLPATGRLGTQTHAALLGALRALGDRAPVRVPPVGELLDRLAAAAAGRRFERRVRDLRGAPDFADAVQRVI